MACRHSNVEFRRSTREHRANGRAAVAEPRGRLDRFFEITGRGSTPGTEVRGGIVTFVTMAYIVILNPIILSGSPDVDGNSLGFEQVAAVTALTAGAMTILFGLVSRLPFAFAAGLGINSFLAVSVVRDVTWPEAMGLVMVNGLIIVLLAATGLRRLIFDAVPVQLKTAITVGIGLFIAFIGFVDAGFVTVDRRRVPSGRARDQRLDRVDPDPALRRDAAALRRAHGAAGPGRAAHRTRRRARSSPSSSRRSGLSAPADPESNPTGWRLTVPQLPDSWVSLPDLSLVGQVDPLGAFVSIGAPAAIGLIFTLVFTNFFDAMGTMTGLSRESGLADAKGDFPRLRSALIVEGVGAVAGGFTSSSSNTVFVESALGHRRGRANRDGEPRDRRPVPARDVPDAADDDRAVRDRVGRARHRRVAHDGADPPRRPDRAVDV